MANNITIGVIAESKGFAEAYAELDNLKSKELEILKKMEQLRKEGTAASFYAKNAEEQSKATQKFGAALADEIKKLKDVRSEISKTEKSIEELSKAQKAIPETVPSKVIEKSFRALRKELTEQVNALRLAGKTGTAEYEQLIEKLGEMNDIAGDVSREIKGMASDTYAFDTILEGTQLVAGGFSAAQGAMSLFGAENEDMQKAMVKLQSVIAITTGLQQVQNAVQKESNIMRGIAAIQAKIQAEKELLLRAQLIATNSGIKGLTANEVLLRAARIQNARAAAATAAATSTETAAAAAGKAANIGLAGSFRLVSVAIKSIPVLGWVVAAITGIIAAISIFTSKAREAKKETAEFQKAVADLAKEPVASINKLSEQWKKLGDNLQEKEKFVKSNKEEFNKLGVSISNVRDAENLLVANKDNFINAQIEKAKATAIFNQSAEDVEKLIKAQQKLDEANKKPKVVKFVSQGQFGPALSYETDNPDIAKYQKEVDDINAKLKAKITLGIKFEDNAAEELKKSGIVTTAEQDAADERARIAKEEEEKKAEIRKQAAENAKQLQEQRNAEIRKAQQDLDTERIAAMEDAENKEIAQLQQSLQNKLKEIKGHSKEEEALREQLIENENAAEDKIREKYKQERIRNEQETEIAIIKANLAEAEKGSEAELDLKKQLLTEQANIEILAVQNSIDSEEEKANKIREINANLQKDITDLTISNTEKRINDSTNKEILAQTQLYESGLISKYDYNQNIKKLEIDSLQQQIDARRAAGESTIELEKELSERRIAISEEEKNTRVQLFQQLIDLFGQIGGYYFDSQKEQLQQQSDDLAKFYTTDAEEAKNNKDKKLISAKELEKKQLEIKRKQAQVDKEQAIFNASIQYAQGMVSALASGAQGGLAAPAKMAAFAAIMTAGYLANIIAISSKPLPKYAKGRKGGKGEYAQLHKDEIMWVPDGASIMPANDSRRALRGENSMFDKWNMPRIEPNIPKITLSPRIAKLAEKNLHSKQKIDYDLVGKSIAKHIKIPNSRKERSVTVNVDRNGVIVEDGNTSTKVLNSKFTGIL